MRINTNILSSRLETIWPRRKTLALITLPFLLGALLALSIIKFGLITLPVVLTLLIALPWFVKAPYRLFIWLVITWPILTLYIRVPLPAGIPDLTYERVLILLLLGIVVVEAALFKRQLMKVTPLDILVMCYVIAQMSSRLFVLWFGGLGEPDLDGFVNIVLIPVALYWLVKNLLVTKQQLFWFLNAFVIGCLLICFTGLYEQAVGQKLFFVSASLGGTELPYEWQDIVGMRASGALINPAIYGATLGMGILTGFACLPYIKRKLLQVTFVAISLILIFGVFASYTRSAWVSVFSVLFIAQFLINKMWHKTLPIIGLAIPLLALLWSLIPQSSAILSRAMTIDTINTRFNLIILGWEKFLEKPILGWGSGALHNFGLTYLRLNSHNTYLTLLVDGGFFLFLSFLAVVVYVIIRAYYIFKLSAKSSFERSALVAAIGCTLIFLLSGLALELRIFSYFNALLWIFIGIIDHLGEIIGQEHA